MRKFSCTWVPIKKSIYDNTSSRDCKHAQIVDIHVLPPYPLILMSALVVIGSANTASLSPLLKASSSLLELAFAWNSRVEARSVSGLGSNIRFSSSRPREGNGFPISQDICKLKKIKLIDDNIYQLQLFCRDSTI